LRALASILRRAQDDVMDRVVIAAFRERPDAVAAERALASAAIASEVCARSNELPRLCVDAFADGFDVVVDESEANAAIALLQRLWPDEPLEARTAERCPECGSSDVFRLRRLLLFGFAAAALVVAGAMTGQNTLFVTMAAIVALLLAITPPWRCRACRASWRAR
jgi:hypothetical protein